MTLYELLEDMIKQGASDLHITTGSPPQIRINGSMVAIDSAPLKPAETKALAYSVLTDAQKMKFEEENELDLSFGLKGLSRFRANIFSQRGSVAAAIRQIPFEIRPLSALGVPKILETLTRISKGLILVTGPTGSGKSTTLAAMIDLINQTRHFHIITVEDPIEYLHPHKKSIVNQREIGVDTKNFPSALKYILRQDPDVVLVGEMRDLETIEAALTIAETGHLTFATLHTNSAAQTISRIVDVFPGNQQSQIRAQLSFVLEGVVSQQLLPTADNTGRAIALEIMVPNAAIRNLIRENKVHQIYSAMQTGQGENGMQTMNQSLATLVQKRKISLKTAVAQSSDKRELKTLLMKVGINTVKKKPENITNKSKKFFK